MQPGPVCTGERGTRADALVAAALQIVQADPYVNAVVRVIGGALQQKGIMLKGGCKRLGIGNIRDDYRPNSDLTRGGEGRLGANAHIDDGRRSRQQRLGVGRERPDIALTPSDRR